VNRINASAGTLTTRHLYITLDGGGTWVDASGIQSAATSLPDMPVRGCSFTDEVPSTTVMPAVVVATELGVLVTRPTAFSTAFASWSRLGWGLPSVPATALEVRADAARVRVATWGRGVWEWGAP
jgi:hypothetical protein